MKVLILHNRYRAPGGEDAVVQAEADLLTSRGIEVECLECDNHVPQDRPWRGTLKLTSDSAWSREWYETVRHYCNQHRPDVVHVHNFWMRLSPSVHAAASDCGVATVQTLHNFRLTCLNALLLHSGEVCEACVGRVPWRGLIRGCYRDSRVASGVVARMIVSNRRRRTWQQHVDAFIALTAHAKETFIRTGLPADLLFVKPNFVSNPGAVLTPPSISNLILYVGRLSHEKGVRDLIQAWSRIELTPEAHLTILGDGPQRAVLERQARDLGLLNSRIKFLGHQGGDVVARLIEEARAIVVPSCWYEGFPRIVVETMARGRALVVSDLGSLRELIRHGRTGLRFPSGDLAALAGQLAEILSNSDLADQLGSEARSEYLSKYTPERNFQSLMQVYESAVRHRHHVDRTKSCSTGCVPRQKAAGARVSGAASATLPATSDFPSTALRERRECTASE